MLINTVTPKDLWWKPWANTFWYYTFDDQNASQITDFSGNNRNLIWWTMPSYTIVSWTNYAGNYANVSWSAAPYTNYSSLSTNFTILLWIKPTTNSSGYAFYLRSTSWVSWQIALIYWYNSETFEYFDDNNHRTTIKSWASVNNWYLVWFTRSWNTIQTYANWSAWNSITGIASTWFGDFYLWSSISWDRLKGQIWECVVENKVRTAEEVANYYNQTKSNYWL